MTTPPTNRPIYETSADLVRETDIISIVEQAWNCKATKLAIKYHLDYVFTRKNKAFGFCEIKTRTSTMDHIDNLGGYMLSLDKWMAAIRMSHATDLPFVLIVKTTDDLYYSMFGKNKHPFETDDVRIMGRVDRNDWQDIEPCVVIRTDKFKKLKD